MSFSNQLMGGAVLYFWLGLAWFFCGFLAYGLEKGAWVDYRAQWKAQAGYWGPCQAHTEWEFRKRWMQGIWGLVCILWMFFRVHRCYRSHPQMFIHVNMARAGGEG